MIKSSKLLVVSYFSVSALLYSTPLMAQTKLSDVEIFSRCYFKLLKAVVPLTASLGKTLADNVYSKKISGPDACARLLDQVEFIDGTKNLGPLFNDLPKLSEKENEQIIGNLNNLHSSWFT